MPFNLDDLDLDSVGSAPDTDNSVLDDNDLDLPDPEPETPAEETPEATPEAEKEAPEAESTEEEEGGEEAPSSFIQTLTGQFGYDFGDAEFSDDEDGVIQLARAAADKMFEEKRNRYAQEKTEAAKFLEYLEAGGNPAQYIQTAAPEVNYLDIEAIPETDTALQERVVRDEMLYRGVAKEKVDKLVEQYKAGGILQDQAEFALEELQTSQKEATNRIVQAQKELRDKQIQKQREYFNRITQRVQEAKDFSGLPIAEKDRSSFAQFIVPDENTGISTYQQKIAGLTDDQVLTIQYLVFQGFDLSKIVDTKVKTEKARSLTERLRSSERQPNSTATKRQKQTSNIEDLDI
jgi:hypothetical protein